MWVMLVMWRWAFGKTSCLSRLFSGPRFIYVRRPFSSQHRSEREQGGAKVRLC